jgi:hypothetical protein
MHTMTPAEWLKQHPDTPDVRVQCPECGDQDWHNNCCVWNGVAYCGYCDAVDEKMVAMELMTEEKMP